MSALEEIASRVPGIVDDPRRRRAAALVTIAVTLAVCGLFYASIYNAWFGPFTVETKSLVGLESPPLRRWVRLVKAGEPVTYDHLEPTGVVEERIGRGYTESVAFYGVLDVDGKELLVRASEQQDWRKPLVGLLVANPGHSQISQYGPVILDLDVDHGLLGWGVSLGAILVILFALDQLRRAGKKPREMPPPLS